MVVDRPASPGSPLLFDIHSDIPDPAERGDGDRLILDGTDPICRCSRRAGSARS